MTTTPPAPASTPTNAPDRARPGVRIALLTELDKLTVQARTRIAFVLCLVGPFGFAIALKVAGTVPADTLFGRWVDDSGFAVPLVVLGFASSWGFPLLACLVAGDIFSAEDQHGTWKTILTRSTSLSSIFAAKVIAAGLYVVSMLALLSMSSLAAGVLVEGHAPLVGLSGTLISGSNAVWLILLSWCTALLPVLSFASFGVLLSISTRNSLLAILLPTVLGFGLQLLTQVPLPGPLRVVLPNTALLGWHGLFTDPRFTNGIVTGTVVGLGYLLLCLIASWVVLARRDFSGD